MNTKQIFAVTGPSILNNNKPLLYNAAFRSLNYDGIATRISAKSPKELFAIASEIGVSGLDVDSSLGEDLYPFTINQDLASRTLHSVTTIIPSEDTLLGYNIAPEAIQELCKDFEISPKQRHIVILGTDNCAKAAAFFCLSKHASTVTIVDSSFKDAQRLAAGLGCSSCSADTIHEAFQQADILISALKAPFAILPKEALHPRLIVFDTAGTPLLNHAKAIGCHCISRTEWNLRQASVTFQLFTGEKAPFSSMRQALYSAQSFPHNIALIGMMGAGKSTVSKALHTASGLPLFDIDAEVERTAGKTIADIFSTEGEEGFRKQEHESLLNLPSSPSIIDCGGGIITSQENRAFLKEKAIVICLWADIDTLIKRASSDPSRPLTSNISKLFRERRHHFAKTADMIVSSLYPPHTIAENILHEIHCPLENQWHYTSTTVEEPHATLSSGRLFIQRPVPDT